jgi:hypothetical protein
VQEQLLPYSLEKSGLHDIDVLKKTTPVELLYTNELRRLSRSPAEVSVTFRS